MDLAKANNAFAWNAYAAIIHSDPSSNVFFSPYSITAILHMLYFGAKDNTQQQLSKTLYIDKISVETVERDYLTLCKHINEVSGGDQGGITLQSGNRLYVEQSYNIRKDYIDRFKNLQSEVKPSDFHGHCEEVRQEINTWVEEQTAMKIKGILPQGSVSAQTRMLLINAIYFKGIWSKPFEKHETSKDKFYHLDGSNCLVDMMHQKDDFSSFHDASLHATILKLKFGTRRVSPASMVILLPDKVDGLPILEATLKTGATLRLGECRECKTFLYLPKMRIEHSLPLTQVLQSIGVEDLFSAGAANLGGISDAGNLYVNNALHKAFIDVDEEGAEAIAVTAADCTDGCAPPEKTITIRVDHPFVLLIMEEKTESILFMGRVLDLDVTS